MAQYGPVRLLIQFNAAPAGGGPFTWGDRSYEAGPTAPYYVLDETLYNNLGVAPDSGALVTTINVALDADSLS